MINKNLLSAISNLAKTPEEQIKYLESIGTYPCLDELGLEYDDFFRLLKQEEEKGIDNATFSKMLKLDALLCNIGGSHNERFWYYIEALRLPEWNEIRELAKDILNDIYKIGITKKE
jgi:hypothetical protein